MRALVGVAVAAVLLSSGASPAHAAELELVDVPATVQIGSESSVGAFVPRQSRCRLILRSGEQRQKGPRAKASSGYMQFPWTQMTNSASGGWELRVNCRRQGAKWRSAWTAYEVTQVRQTARTVSQLARPASASLSSVWQSYGWQPFGTTLVKGSQWFGGRGVDVRSNGGNGCASGCSLRGTYGTKYQCVELVNRFARTQGWVTSNILGNASQIYTNAPSSVFAKYRRDYVPVPGDIIVWKGGSTGYGHVAVVSEVEGSVVTFVEQNASRSGMHSLELNDRGRLANYGALRHMGFLHAHANTAQ